MTLDENWFSETDQDMAFSLRIRGKLHEEQTPFQKIEVYDTVSFGKLMVIDGCVMLTDRDNFIYHEMMAHPVLFAHPNPKKVLIIGGGDCGTLREVLKHDCVQRAIQVDIDERVTRVSEQFFPQLCEANDDPRADLRFDDGIAYVKNAEPGSIDVIVIDSTDPVGPAEGLFSTPFYKDCLRALGRDGLLVQQSESPLLHTDSIIRPMHDSLRAAGFLDMLTLHFPQASYPSGWWTATIAAKDATVCFHREEAAEELGFHTDYYNAAIQRAAAATPEFFRRKLFA
ncbi:polyamine aminopropyltransferase [Thioalkalivibrio sp.]|uniref:polyamine aminopropyltransferase n=1 Tax=Thioalkalivibrio sp. TaxID=2093813 RepID=UPI003563608B